MSLVPLRSWSFFLSQENLSMQNGNGLMVTNTYLPVIDMADKAVHGSMQ